MNIAHLYWANNNNWGDVVVGDITQHLFTSYLGKHNFNTFSISKDFVNQISEINKNDLLLIGGGGIFIWLGHFIHNTNKLKDIKIPIVIYSIGLNVFKCTYTNHNVIQYKSDFLELLKEKCLFVSARNDGTSNAILDFNKVNFHESPEPCIYTNQYYQSERLIKNKYILFCLANDMSECRFKYNNVNFTYFRNKIQALIEILKNDYIIQPIYHRKEDESFNIPNTIEWNIENELQSKDISKGLSLYQHADIVISMRGHGQIIPFSYNVPVITIANQNKNIGFAQSVNITDSLIDIKEPNLVNKIIRITRNIEHNIDKIKQQYQEIKKRLLLRTEEDFSIIKNKLNL